MFLEYTFACTEGHIIYRHLCTEQRLGTEALCIGICFTLTEAISISASCYATALKGFVWAVYQTVVGTVVGRGCRHVHRQPFIKPSLETPGIRRYRSGLVPRRPPCDAQDTEGTGTKGCDISLSVVLMIWVRNG